MAWERGYFYRVIRRCRRVNRVYCGRGELAEVMAKNVRLGQEIRRQQNERLQLIRSQLANLEALTADIDGLADLVADAAMVAAGYRRHHRGEWRKKRERSRSQNPPDEGVAGASTVGGRIGPAAGPRPAE